MSVTFYGPSCTAIKVAGKALLFDPFVRQDKRARDLDMASVRADGRRVTHGRFDRGADAAEFAGRAGAPLIADGHVARRLRRQGVKETMQTDMGVSPRLPVGAPRDF